MQRKMPSTTTDTKLTLPASGVTEVLTVADTAALLKVPASSIYEWTRFRGTQRTPIPHRKVGKYLRFLRSEVEAWGNEQAQARAIRNIAWTLSYEVAERFTKFGHLSGMPDGRVYRAQIKRSEVFAYVEQRNEQEVLVVLSDSHTVEKL